MDVTAFLLAGGMGKRMRGITCLPKCMIAINEKPVLFHWIDSLSTICDKIYISLFYRCNRMRSCIQNKYPDLVNLDIICDGRKGQWAHAEYIAEQVKTDKIAIILADNYWEGFDKGEQGIDKLRELLMIPNDKAMAIGYMPQVFSSGKPGSLAWNGMLIIRTEGFRLLVPQFDSQIIIGETIIPFIKNHYKYHTFLMPGFYIDIGSEININRLKTEGYKIGL